jgi:hypothetical protein
MLQEKPPPYKGGAARTGTQDREVAGLFAFENPTDVDTGKTIGIGEVGSVAEQATDLDELTPKV